MRNVLIITVCGSFIVVHTHLVMLLYLIPKYPLVIQLLWHIFTHCNGYSFYYAALTSLIAHLFSCSQLGKSVDCTTCRCQMTNSVFELMHPLSPSQMITITMILIGIVAKLPSKGKVNVEMKDDKCHQTLTLCNCVFVHTQNLNYWYRIDAT